MSVITEEAVFEQVTEILTANFNVPLEDVAPQATFRGTFGMDSLDIVDLVFFLQKHFGLQGELEDFRELHTMHKLCRFVHERQGTSAQ